MKSGFMKVAVGGPESTLGTAVARTSRLPATEAVFLKQKATTEEKGYITGRNTKSGYVKTAEECTASVPMNLVASKALNIVLRSLLGSMSTPAQVGCGITITYDGAEDSCKLVVAADSISASVGNKGSEVADTNFGTAGSYALSGKTLADLVTDISAFTGYNAIALYGEATASAAAAVTIASAQAKNRPVPVHFTSANSGAYLRIFTSLLTNDELPGFSIQADGDGDNRLGAGAVVDSMNITADLKSKVKATLELMMLTVTGGQTAITAAMTEDDMDVLKFSDGMTYIGGEKFCYTKNLSFDISNSHGADEGYCQGQQTKSKHAKGPFAVTGSVTLPVDSASEAERIKALAVSVSSLFARYLGRSYGNGINAAVILDVPAIQYTDDSKSAGDANLEQSLSWEMIDDVSYDAPFAIHTITKESV